MTYENWKEAKPMHKNSWYIHNWIILKWETNNSSNTFKMISCSTKLLVWLKVIGLEKRQDKNKLVENKLRQGRHKHSLWERKVWECKRKISRFPNAFPLLGIWNPNLSCYFGMRFKKSNLIQIGLILDHWNHFEN